MRHRYTKEIITDAVSQAVSWAQVCRLLGIKPATGSQSHIKSVANKYAVPYTHFTGQGWNKNKKSGPKKQLETYLQCDGPFIKSHALKLRLIREGVKAAKCEHCGLVDWLGGSPPLELDHINSNHSDNRLSNLQILCPNCHAVKTQKDRAASGGTGKTRCV